MAIDTLKCRWGSPQVGGKPRQCPLPVTTSIMVQAADKQGPEAMPLCDSHAALMRQRQQGTIYREDGTGGRVPVRVTII